jgi:hypothetical protein
MTTRKVILLVMIMAVFGLLLLAGCSELNTSSSLALVDDSGSHPDGWIEAHGNYALPEGALCIDCHGEELDGGITGISCSSAAIGEQPCHANGPGLHTAGWLDKNTVDFHGDAYNADSAACLVCHDPASPATAPGYNCLDCHFSEDGTERSPGPAYTHGTLTSHDVYEDTVNGDVCITCHAINIAFGYEPGASCHNCHDIHPDNWDDRDMHGAAAVADPGPVTGLDSCRDCHGADLNGGDAEVSCLFTGACHFVAAPHQGSWRSRHDNTDQDNGSICGLCHLGDREPPAYQEPPAGSCFGDTLCHGFED